MKETTNEWIVEMLRYTFAILILCTGIVIGVRLNTHIDPTKQSNQPQAVSITRDNEKLVDDEMGHLLKTIPGSYQTRLAFIHGSELNKYSTLDRIQVDIVANVALQGFKAGKIELNLPLSQWHDFLPTLVANRCPTIIPKNLDDDALRARLKELGSTKEIMGCPLRTENGQLLGGLFVHWNTEPSAHDVDMAYELIRSSAARIEKILGIS